MSLLDAATRWLPTLLALLLASAPAARAAELPSAVSDALQQANIPPQSVGIVVQAVDGGPPLLSHNARQAMNQIGRAHV